MPLGIVEAWLSSPSRTTQPEMSAAVSPALMSSIQSPGVPPLDSTSFTRTSGVGGPSPVLQTTFKVSVVSQSPSDTVTVTETVPPSVHSSSAFAPLDVRAPLVAAH